LISLLMTIPGIDVLSARIILSEIGRDMSRFPTAGHLEWRKSRAVGRHCADAAVGA
jgi:transposase